MDKKMDKPTIFILHYNDIINVSLSLENDNYNSKEEVIEQLSRLLEFKDYDIEYHRRNENYFDDLFY